MNNLDLFPAPFQFEINGNEGKKTTWGGIFSLTVILAALGYFFCLMYTWFSGSLSPKTNITQNADWPFASIELKNDTFMIACGNNKYKDEE